MRSLSDRERQILSERRLKDNPTTLENLSQRYGISRERVRQIEVRAFEKLQKSVKNASSSSASRTEPREKSRADPLRTRSAVDLPGTWVE